MVGVSGEEEGATLFKIQVEFVFNAPPFDGGDSNLKLFVGCTDVVVKSN